MATQKEPTPARRWEGPAVHASVKAAGFWLNLGHVRRLLAQVADLPDDASVTFEGVQASYSRVGERTATEMHVRHEALKAGDPS